MASHTPPQPPWRASSSQSAVPPLQPPLQLSQPPLPPPGYEPEDEEDESNMYDSFLDSYIATSTEVALEYENEFDSEMFGSDEDVNMRPLASPLAVWRGTTVTPRTFRPIGPDKIVEWTSRALG